MKTKNNIERAAKHLNATQISPLRWAHYDDSTGRYYVVSSKTLAELCEYLDDTDSDVSRDAYSHWCAGTRAKEMPQGWEPN